MVTSKKDNTTYIILGMHKSGTTLVSRLLMEAGVHMGSFDMSKGYDAGNQLEMQEAVRINKDLLGIGDTFSLNVQQPLEAERITKQDLEKGESLVEKLNQQYPHWGFKDPRTCLTYNYWEKIIPDHRLIMVYRHPAEVMNHYFRRRYSPTTILRIVRALGCWTAYNSLLLEILTQKKDILLLNFSVLMSTNAELLRLEKFTGLPVKDIRDQKSYRSRGTKSLYYPLALICNKVAGKVSPLAVYKKLENYRAENAIPVPGKGG